MFDSLQTRLGTVFDRLRGRGALSEADVETALGEVRSVLIDADVALPVVKTFIGKVRERAVGESVIRSVTPGQQVVKIVYDTLVETLGAESEGLSLGAPPAPILMVGLQGSGKTTTSAKLASLLQTKDKKRVLMASLDVNRPAAMEQLKVLGEQISVPTLPIILGQRPTDIARRALAAAKVGGYDVLILDTAGRQHVDEALMAEVAEIKKLTNPHETLLVADSLTGQDAVNIAKSFNERVQISGIILTRADGDQGQSGVQSSTASFKERECAVTEAVEKRDAENRPVTAKPTIGEPATDEWQKIDSRREQVQHLGGSVFSHSHPVQQIQFEDPEHPVIAEPFARLIADDEFDLWRKPAGLVRGRYHFRGGRGFELHRGILWHYHVSCNSDTACRGSLNFTVAFPFSTGTVSSAPAAAS